MKKQFEFLEHTADVKFRAFGKSLDEVFENCVLAFSFLVSRGKEVKEKSKKKIEIEGKDNEELLYQLLDELVYLIDAEGFLVSSGDIKIIDGKLVGELNGDNISRYKGLESVKAATYAEMYVHKKGKGWEAQVVLDV